MIPMPMYAILRFQKCKAGGVACRDRHNERKKVEYKSNPNIDLTRSKDNYHLIEPAGRYKDAYTRMIGKAGCKVRSNSTVLVETLVTASPELLNRMTPQEQRQFFERAATFLYKRIGKENVISAVVHMDEKTPHMHLCFCPITKDGRLSAKDILGCPNGRTISLPGWPRPIRPSPGAFPATSPTASISCPTSSAWPRTSVRATVGWRRRCRR